MATKLPLSSELDADLFKSSFISWAKGLPQFKDYDFTGSNLNTLLDILSFNTNQNAFVANMVLSEGFLDSAVQRDSVVSHAKHLNYTPRSSRSAKAIIDVDVTVVTSGSPPTVITIPRGTTFTSRLDSRVFTFQTDKAWITPAASRSPSTNTYVYSFTGVEIFEGSYVSESFEVDTSIEGQRFVLNSPVIDTSSIAVTIAESSSDSTNSEFLEATSLLDVRSDSKVFFIQAANSGKYELLFGDDILGAKPKQGQIIQATYRTSNDEEANGADTFKLASSTLSGYSTFSITTSSAAAGGSVAETMESVKFLAPRHYQTQDRAINNQDYETILLRQFPEIKTLAIYGGQSVVPPKYGKVLISVDLKDSDGIPQSKAKEIEDYIAIKMSPTITPVVVSPDYTYLALDIAVEYDLNSSSLSSSDLQAAILDALTVYDEENFQNFNITFRSSKISAEIDSTDESITSSDLTVRVFKKLSPEANTATSYSLDYQNPLSANTIRSSTFTYAGVGSYLSDNGSGVLNITTTSENGGLSVLVQNIGSVDYTTGKIIITGLSVEEYVGDSINLYASTEQNISVSQNVILAISFDDVTVDVLAVRN